MPMPASAVIVFQPSGIVGAGLAQTDGHARFVASSAPEREHASNQREHHDSRERCRSRGGGVAAR